jgi:hypothetical protein
MLGKDVFTKAIFLLACLLILSLIAALPLHARALSTEPARVYIDPPVVIDQNALFDVSVKVDNLVDLVGIQWSLTWDPTLLRAVNMTEVMFHEVTPQSEWDNIWLIRNKLYFGRAQYGCLWQDFDRAIAGGYFPISGNHTMAIITFQALGVGSCPLRFLRSDTKLGDQNDGPIACEVIDGLFSNSVPPVPTFPIEPSEVLYYVDPHRVMNENFAVNETFTVEVKMDSLTNNSGIIISYFSLSWDPTLLKCINLAINQRWQSQEIRAWVYNDWGECSLWPFNAPIGPPQAVFGNLTLATITFAVTGIGSCSLHLQFCWSEEANAPGVQLSYTPVDGYFTNTLNGDMNGDSVVDIFDALVFTKSFGVHFNGFGWNEAADINGDVQIDVFDAILLGNLFGHTR